MSAAKSVYHRMESSLIRQNLARASSTNPGEFCNTLYHKLADLKVGNQFCCARGCALVRAQNFVRVLDKTLPSFAVAKKRGDCSFE